MPSDVTRSLIDALMAVGKLPELRAALTRFGVQQTELAASAYEAALKKERAGYASVIVKAGIKAP
jgi:tripartite-type tricarboxylate transporter receptor subunit TctC